MNWDAIAALAAVVSILITIGGCFYISGKLAQRVSDHGLKLNEHGDRLDTHEKRIGNHDIDLARLEGFREGVASTRHAHPEAHE